MSPYNLGIFCRKIGKSIHYNPFRNKGSSDDFIAWEAGWNSENAQL